MKTYKTLGSANVSLVLQNKDLDLKYILKKKLRIHNNINRWIKNDPDDLDSSLLQKLAKIKNLHICGKTELTQLKLKPLEAMKLVYKLEKVNDIYDVYFFLSHITLPYSSSFHLSSPFFSHLTHHLLAYH